MNYCEVERMLSSTPEIQFQYDRLGIARALKIGGKARLICIRVSTAYFRSPDFQREVGNMVNRLDAAPSGVCFEFDEDVLLRDIKQTKICFKALRSLGIKILIAGFGYRFFEYSKIPSFEIDVIKISGDLIRNFFKEDAVQSIMYDIFAYAKVKKIETIAEGIDAVNQKKLMQKFGCYKMQGSLKSLQGRGR